MSNIERKIKLMIAASMLLVSGIAYSQMSGQSGQQMPPSQPSQPPATSQATPSNEVQDALTRISTELNLTEDQKGKLKPILENELSQLVGLRNDTSMSTDVKQTKAKAIHESANSQISAILTPEQQQKWDAMKPR
jgi:Spy/CpxP family protein refolding chaperone